MGEAPAVIGVDPLQLGPRAFPEVEVGPEGKARGAVASAAAVRMAREQVEPGCGEHQERRIPRGKQCFGTHRGGSSARIWAIAAGVAEAGAVISVNRTSASSGVLLDAVADPEVADVEQRHHAAGDEHDVARKADPFDQRVRVVGQELQRAGLVVAGVDRLVELDQPEREEGRERSSTPARC